MTNFGVFAAILRWQHMHLMGSSVFLIEDCHRLKRLNTDCVSSIVLHWILVSSFMMQVLYHFWWCYVKLAGYSGVEPLQGDRQSPVLTDIRIPHLDWRRGGESNTQFLAESHFQCDALPFCTPLQIAGGRGGSRTHMRLSPPFVSSEDLYHLGELFH